MFPRENGRRVLAWWGLSLLVSLFQLSSQFNPTSDSPHPSGAATQFFHWDNPEQDLVTVNFLSELERPLSSTSLDGEGSLQDSMQLAGQYQQLMRPEVTESHLSQPTDPPGWMLTVGAQKSNEATAESVKQGLVGQEHLPRNDRQTLNLNLLPEESPQSGLALDYPGPPAREIFVRKPYHTSENLAEPQSSAVAVLSSRVKQKSPKRGQLLAEGDFPRKRKATECHLDHQDLAVSESELMITDRAENNVEGATTLNKDKSPEIGFSNPNSPSAPRRSLSVQGNTPSIQSITSSSTSLAHPQVPNPEISSELTKQQETSQEELIFDQSSSKGLNNLESETDLERKLEAAKLESLVVQLDRGRTFKPSAKLVENFILKWCQLQNLPEMSSLKNFIDDVQRIKYKIFPAKQILRFPMNEVVTKHYYLLYVSERKIFLDFFFDYAEPVGTRPQYLQYKYSLPSYHLRLIKNELLTLRGMKICNELGKEGDMESSFEQVHMILKLKEEMAGLRRNQHDRPLKTLHIFKRATMCLLNDISLFYQIMTPFGAQEKLEMRKQIIKEFENLIEVWKLLPIFGLSIDEKKVNERSEYNHLLKENCAKDLTRLMNEKNTRFDQVYQLRAKLFVAWISSQSGWISALWERENKTEVIWQGLFTFFEDSSMADWIEDYRRANHLTSK